MDFSLLKPSPRAYGPLPKFVFEDVLRAFWLVGTKKLVGRREIADSLDLGEGTARSIAAFLAECGLAKKIQGGCMLSETGSRLFGKLRLLVLSARQLTPMFSTLDRPSFCLQCSLGVEPSVSSSVAARDAAVKAGSEGVVSLYFKRKQFVFLGTGDSIAGKDAKVISSAFAPSEGELFILSFARKPLDRERGAWAAFLSFQRA
ncbi:TPA: hypothetical protein HA244_05305 [Candidatus Micrarchaeota archaeon]|nr:hypothetical protein [Candidatus Micrarchaeota archaeon]